MALEDEISRVFNLRHGLETGQVHLAAFLFGEGMVAIQFLLDEEVAVEPVGGVKRGRRRLRATRSVLEPHPGCRSNSG